jgi:hypothetical protein
MGLSNWGSKQMGAKREQRNNWKWNKKKLKGSSNSKFYFCMWVAMEM